MLDLSDDVLLIMVKMLPSCVDVFRLSETCTRLGRICKDETLWIRVDTRHAKPLSLREFRWGNKILSTNFEIPLHRSSF